MGVKMANEMESEDIISTERQEEILELLAKIIADAVADSDSDDIAENN